MATTATTAWVGSAASDRVSQFSHPYKNLPIVARRRLRLLRRILQMIVASFLAAAVLAVSELPASGANSDDLSSVVEVMGALDHLWILSSTGAVEPIGSAPVLGDGVGGDFAAGAASPTGNGYWLARRNGTVQAFGDAPFAGEFTGLAAGTYIVDMAATSSGQGYWLVASDGGIFTFGDAGFHGSTGALRLNQPVLAMAPTPTDNGYWLVASDGGIFTFGDAKFMGSTGDIRLNQPVIGMAATGSGNGYWLVASDGGLFTFGDAGYLGSLGGHWTSEVVGVHATGSNGYVMVDKNARLAEFNSTRPNLAFGAFTARSESREAAIASELYAKLTAERDARGLPSLLWDARIAIGSESWSGEMSNIGFRHSNVQRVFNSLGNYDSLGENIYRGSADFADSGSAHNAFMNSDEHRDTLLASQFTTVGIGVVCDPSGQLWVTVRFGTPAGHAPSGTRPVTSAEPVVASDRSGSSC